MSDTLALAERTNTSGKACVLLVDDHALLRTGVASIINQEPDLHVVAEASNGVEAIEAYKLYQPDVTLLDLRMPVMEGVEAVRRIRELDPRARVIVLTTYDTDDDIARAFRAGAKAYALKDISTDDLVSCIRDVLAGRTCLARRARRTGIICLLTSTECYCVASHSAQRTPRASTLRKARRVWIRTTPAVN